MAIQPIFIFSAVRSGSTLVQRILAAHEGVATVSEPWLLLPLASTLRRTGVDGGYLHPLTVDAIEDFCAQLPGGSEDIYARAAQPRAAAVRAGSGRGRALLRRQVAPLLLRGGGDHAPVSRREVRLPVAQPTQHRLLDHRDVAALDADPVSRGPVRRACRDSSTPTGRTPRAPMRFDSRIYLAATTAIGSG